MQTGAKLGQFRKSCHCFFRKIPGMRCDKTQPLKTWQRRHLAQQLRKGGSVSSIVASEDIDILSQQGDISRASCQPCAALIQYGGGWARLARPPRERHDTVSTEVVTALHDIHKCHGRDIVSRLFVQTGIPIRIPGGKVKVAQTQPFFLQQADKGVRNMDNAVTACHETYLGMTLHEVFAKLLRHAAAHAHHGARIDLPDPPERTVHLQFRLRRC